MEAFGTVELSLCKSIKIEVILVDVDVCYHTLLWGNEVDYHFMLILFWFCQKVSVTDAQRYIKRTLFFVILFSVIQ